jgi:hypothetical protein
VLVAAAFVPNTALLVPGAAGTAIVLGPVRVAALAAVGGLAAALPDRVVVVAEHPHGPPRRLSGPHRPSLAAAGIDDDVLRGPWPEEPAGPGRQPEPHAPVGVSVTLYLLRAGGWAGPVDVVTVAADDAARLREVGADLAAGPDRVGLLLAGTLSARRGPDSPLSADPRAAAVDDAILADLAVLGPHAVARLAAVPAQLARDLAISVWGPLQVLLGALRDGASCTVHHGGSLSGTRYAVLSWRWP